MRRGFRVRLIGLLLAGVLTGLGPLGFGVTVVFVFVGVVARVFGCSVLFGVRLIGLLLAGVLTGLGPLRHRAG
jgi:hypothetical protein